MTDSKRVRRRREVTATEKEGVLRVATVHKIGKQVVEERDDAETILVRQFLTEPAMVRVNAGMTKNIGDFEFIRVDVDLTIPCYQEEVNKVFPMVADKVAAYLASEIKQYTRPEK